jgi:hypothetical protein
MTNVTILNEFDQSLNTTDNVTFNQWTVGDSDGWIESGFWDLTPYGLTKLAYLKGHSSSGDVDGFFGIHGTPLILTNSQNMCYAGFDMDNIAGGVQQFCYSITNNRWEFTDNLSIGGDLSVGGSLQGGLTVPQANNITFLGQNGYNPFCRVDWNGANYDMHCYDNTGTYYYGLTNNNFVIPHILQSSATAYSYIDLDNDGQAEWHAYGSGGNRTAFHFFYGGSGINEDSTFWAMSNMGTPGLLFNLTGGGSLWLRQNITINGTFNGNGSGLTSLPSDNSKLNITGGTITNNLSINGELAGTRQLLLSGQQGAQSISQYQIIGGGGTIRATATEGFPMLRSGSITGMSTNFKVTANTTIGNISVQQRVNGTQIFNITIPVVALQTYNSYITFPRGTYNFSAGDVLQTYVNFDSFVGSLNPTIIETEITVNT